MIGNVDLKFGMIGPSCLWFDCAIDFDFGMIMICDLDFDFVMIGDVDFDFDFGVNGLLTFISGCLGHQLQLRDDWAIDFDFGMIGGVDNDFSMIGNVKVDFGVIGPSTLTLE